MSSSSHLIGLLLAVASHGVTAWSGACPLCAAPRVQGRASSATMSQPVTKKIAIVGGGTVGGGIVEILGSKSAFVKEALGVDIQIKTIVVRDASKPRDFEVPAGCDITEDVTSVLADDEVDMVVEVMGGTTLAKDVVVGAIKAGKHVVTANKALIAAELPMLESLISTTNAARAEDVGFGYEAAVCGGIPIIHTLQRDLIGDDVQQISGIINGCTNFMLSGMEGGDKTYGDALKEASELGYAEADPTLDVMGFDARSKLRILMKLAFGIDVEEDEIPCRGITEITPTDFEYAGLLQGTVKLLGVAKLDSLNGNRMSAFVSPCFVPDTNTLSSISGATNAVQISSTSLQQSIFVGQGAGRFPTANSCVSDILAICQGQTSPPFPKQAMRELKFENSFKSAFYLRIRFRDRTGIIADLGQICTDAGVSIYSILQNPIADKNDAQFVVMTDPCDISAIKEACVKLEATPWCLGNTFYMPVL